MTDPQEVRALAGLIIKYGGMRGTANQVVALASYVLEFQDAAAEYVARRAEWHADPDPDKPTRWALADADVRLRALLPQHAQEEKP